MKREGWERLEEETSRAYEAFSRYRDLGPLRSFEKLRKSYTDATGKPLYASDRQFTTWSSRFSWVERATAYDDHLERIKLLDEMEAIRKERKATRDTHRAISKGMQKIILGRIFPDEADPKKIMDPSELRAGDIPRWVETATSLERLTLEMPTENIAINKSEDGVLDGYATPEWLSEHTKALLDLGLLKPPGPEGNSSESSSEIDRLHPDNPDP